MSVLRSDPHRHFRDLAASALDFDLGALEAGDLAAHLGTCEPCRSHAAALGADDVLLRGLPLFGASHTAERPVGTAPEAQMPRRPAFPWSRHRS